LLVQLTSLFTGSLIARFGAVRIMSLGIALLSAHVLLSVTGAAIVSFGAALVALGIGWNSLYVGGTTLLTSTYAPPRRPAHKPRPATRRR